MKHRILFEKWNEDTESWISPPFYRCWAYINGLSGSEYWAAQAVQAENTVQFTVRYCRKLDEIVPQAYHIVYHGESYDIKHIDNVKFENRWIKIKAVKKIGRKSEY